MEEIDISESFVQDDQKNQFLDGEFKYESCPHCSRNFFLGKLKYHLKLCKPNNPMTKSPLKKAKRSYISTTIQKSESDIQNLQLQSPTSTKPPQKSAKYPKCQYCRASFPFSLIQRHSQKCNLKPSNQEIIYGLDKLKSKTKINFGIKKDFKEPASALPRIRNQASQHKNFQRKLVSQEVKDLKAEYTVRIREELSCFKKALQVQQIECQYCHRRFSKEASLRHIPICEKIKMQEIQQVALKKHSKSQIYKVTVPIKKSTLFRSKFLSSPNQQNQAFQIKSARLYQIQKVERQKISNSSLLIKEQRRNLNELKPLIAKPTQNFNKKIQKNQLSLDQVTLTKGSTQQMNMTFSKGFNKANTTYGLTINFSNQKQIKPRLPSFQKQRKNYQNQLESQHQKLFSDQKEKKIQTEGVQNEFLEVTISKTNIYAQISFDKKEQPVEDRRQEQIQQNGETSQKIKLQIDFVDSKRN